jgi:hypothetical protein
MPNYTVSHFRIHGREDLEAEQHDLETVLMAYTRKMLGSYLGRDISYPD